MASKAKAAATKGISEHTLQVRCVHWMRANYPDEVLICIDNNARNPTAGHIKKLKGAWAGFPDLFLFSPSERFSGLAIELKTAAGRMSPAQKATHELLAAKGYKVAVIRSEDEFRRLISDFLGD